MHSSYIEYLNEHRKGVLLTYLKVYQPILKEEQVSLSVRAYIRSLCSRHDSSKYEEPEYTPYCNFYDNKGDKDEVAYQLAWNHHQKSNPHHWQYWVLLRDSEEPHIVALDMPFEYIIEMLCDWTSASMLHNTTALAWYEAQKDNMILSDNTRSLVEHYLYKAEGV